MMKLQREPADLCQLAREVVELYQYVAEEKKVAIRTELPVPCEATVDRIRMRQVFANLLDNAIKYTPAGGRVELEVAPTEAGALFYVTDDGPGIAPQHLSRLFERFYRVDKARSRELGGTGLGLSIVRHLAESMGASVSVESEPGRGSRFTVTIPGRGAGGTAV